MECNTGIVIPTLIEDICNGEKVSTSCVVDSNTYVDLGISANSTQTQINQSIYVAMQTAQNNVEDLTIIVNDLNPEAAADYVIVFETGLI
jgi:hypothetical protein